MLDNLPLDVLRCLWVLTGQIGFVGVYFVFHTEVVTQFLVNIVSNPVFLHVDATYFMKIHLCRAA